MVPTQTHDAPRRIALSGSRPLDAGPGRWLSAGLTASGVRIDPKGYPRECPRPGGPIDPAGCTSRLTSPHRRGCPPKPLRCPSKRNNYYPRPRHRRGQPLRSEGSGFHRLVSSRCRRAIRFRLASLGPKNFRVTKNNHRRLPAKSGER